MHASILTGVDADRAPQDAWVRLIHGDLIQITLQRMSEGLGARLTGMVQSRTLQVSGADMAKV